MTYTADDTLATDVTFQARIRMAIVQAANAVASEARTVRNTVDQKRNSLANKVLNDPATYVIRFTYAAIRAGNLLTGSTDAQIDTAVSSVWNGVAGVTTADLA